MDIKSISVNLTAEERMALYEAATRECRRPDQQARWLLRAALGLNRNRQEEQQPNNTEELVMA
jgi:hypothetical protein